MKSTAQRIVYGKLLLGKCLTLKNMVHEYPVSTFKDLDKDVAISIQRAVDTINNKFKDLADKMDEPFFNQVWADINQEISGWYKTLVEIIPTLPENAPSEDPELD